MSKKNFEKSKITQIRQRKYIFLIITLIVVLALAGWLVYDKLHYQNPNGSSSTKLIIKTQDNSRTWAVGNVLARKILIDINNRDAGAKRYITDGINGCYPNYGSSRNFYLYFTNPNREYTDCAFISMGGGEDLSAIRFSNDFRAATNNY